MKEVDETPVGESGESEEDVWTVLSDVESQLFLKEIVARVYLLEKELALLLEQRVTVRAPECQEDPEWYS